MKLKTWLPAILAVFLGVAAAVLVRHSMTRPKPPEAVIVTPRMVPALAATNNLMAGQEIKAEDVEITEVTSSNPPQKLISNPSELVGRVLSAPINKGQTVTQASLAPLGAPATLISLVPEGKRAVTINVDEGNSFSGMLVPGAHVDVLGSVAAGKDSISRTLMTNILVQAVGQRLSSARPEDGKEPPPFHTVTLIVTLHQAELIDLAQQTARMRLVLRPLGHNAADDVTSDKVTMTELLSGDDKPAMPLAPATATQPVSDAKIVSAAPLKNDVVFIVGSTVTHVKLDMPDAPPTIQADTHIDLQPVIPEGREPLQE